MQTTKVVLAAENTLAKSVAKLNEQNVDGWRTKQVVHTGGYVLVAVLEKD